ncbi:hypothetical protein QE429_004250 [Bacillus sp. SORGH_AS 510]|nr:hypothetical protein [Bacillus sp. SORGH_AS_0510]MDQ1147423.1 hypothetical protein [Bacillus sp. SORGH_AS_0510]
MTWIHVLNYSIPIAFMVFAGFFLDRLCKPAKQEDASTGESPSGEIK